MRSRPLLPLLPLAALLCFSAETAGCERGRLRPLNPCTTAGVSEHIEVDEVDEVDLLFMIDDSGSMREEQEKLRRELPRMVNALITGDLDGNGTADGPRVKSLRVGVVTSDMGVGGIGEDDFAHAIQSCGAVGTSFDYGAAHYGDDGVLRDTALEPTVAGSPSSYDCDLDDDGFGDTVPSDTLPAYLTFDAPDDTTTPAAIAALDEFVRRAACLTNVGVAGCAFEQPLEAVLKAVTPPSASDALLGGAFHHAGNDLEARLGHGRGPDPIDANARNASWFRDDSLLAIVLVTDEDDCSASDPEVYDSRSERPGFDDPYDQFQGQTRCVRYGGELVHPIERYARGLIARRAGHEGRLVFAAITGVPPDLTDEADEGVDHVDAILADPRMTVTLQPNERVWNGVPTQIPDGEIAPACQHAVAGAPVLTATATLTTTSATLVGVDVPSGTPSFGMGVTGPGLQQGTTVRAVTGTGPYTLQLSARPLVAGAGVTLTLTELDVSAVPARRIVEVARALTTKTPAQPATAHAIVQSICVDDFRPAVQRILRLIQSQLSSGCLPRPLIRTRENVVSCDVLVTLPPGLPCDDPALAGIYSPLPGDREEVVIDGVPRERCTMIQVPVAAGTGATEAERLPAGAKGWYYDDFTAELPIACVTDVQRLAFVMGSKPPDGSRVDFSCLQSVQDGELAVDIGSACTMQCAFPTEADASEFTLRYNLGATSFDASADFRCEPESNTCQIHCTTDAACPGGYVCFDDPGPAEAICVNPVCGSGL